MPPDAISTVIRKARKVHVCSECCDQIAANESYEYVSGVWDGSPDSFKTCLLCVEWRDAFITFAGANDMCPPPLGRLISYLYEHAHEISRDEARYLRAAA